jgi:hypothetical protein
MNKSAATKLLKRNGTQTADRCHIQVDLTLEISCRDKRSVFMGNLHYKVESSVEEYSVLLGVLWQ